MSATLVTSRVASEILGIHPQTLRDWSRRGLHDLPTPIQMGGRFRWDATELYAWIERRKRRRVAT